VPDHETENFVSQPGIGAGSLAGSRVGRFLVQERLGEGGMGDVYLANDTVLKRQVALKAIKRGPTGDDSFDRRLFKEAERASQLNDEHIARIYDVVEEGGRTFLVMEYVRGMTLRTRLHRPLSPNEFFDVAEQCLLGLAAAHAKGILHCDLKPENLMITPEGRVKILDFGLARQTPKAQPQGAELSTTTGGTRGYVAPEVLLGMAPDERADIFSLGVVFYEALTGRHPFADRSTVDGDSVAQVGGTTQVTLPSPFSPIISRMLATDAGQRYSSCADVLLQLRASRHTLSGKLIGRPLLSRASGRWVYLPLLLLALALIITVVIRSRSGGATPIHSLAVLPFTNVNNDPDRTYFADGMTDELISELSQVSALRVISRSSVMSYRQTPVQDAARGLHVDAVIEGSVLRVNDQIRINVALSSAGGQNLWSKTYQQPAGDVLALQSALARDIVREVQVKLTPQEQKQLAPPQNSVDAVAYESYLQGRFHLNKRTTTDLKAAVEDFHAAISHDPQFDRAYVGLADSYTQLGVYRAIESRQAISLAKEAAQKALEINSQLGEAHASLAASSYFYLDWRGAEDQFKLAIKLNPGYAAAHHWYALFLASNGRNEDAMSEIRVAEALDPESEIIQANIAWCFYLARRYDDAIREAKTIVARDPTFEPAHEYLGQAYLEQKQYELAIKELAVAVELSSGNPSERAELANAYATMGDIEKATTILRQLEEADPETHVSPSDLALIYVGLKEDDRALELLGQAFREKNPNIANIKVHPRYDPIRADPRFRAIEKALGAE
jgi:serine/threonine-protein kinase